MTVSARSHVLAGAAAVLTATAVSVGGVQAASVAAPPSSATAIADVQLSAFASPLLEIFDTLQKTNFYLFSIAEPPFSVFDRAGIVPDFLAAGFPIATQYVLNASDYVAKTVDYAIKDYDPVLSWYPGALRVLTWAARALPQNLGLAVQQIFRNELVGALQTLQFAIANPIQAALYQTLNAGIYAVGGVTARAAAVVQAVADWIPKTAKELADSATVILNAVGNVVANVTYGIQTRDVERVWNSLVVGLLGSNPSGPFDPYVTPTIPDALIDQTIGPGGRIYIVPGLVFNEAPSIRQNLTDLRTSLEEALATDVPEVLAPPFPMFPPPLQSAIPTPWKPTPGPLPVVPVAASVASVQAPTAVADVVDPRDTAAAVRDDVAAVSDEARADGTRADDAPAADAPARGKARQSRVAQADQADRAPATGADVSAKSPRSAGARTSR